MQGLGESYQSNLFKSVSGLCFQISSYTFTAKCSCSNCSFTNTLESFVSLKSWGTNKVMKSWSHDEQFRYTLPAFSSSLLASFSQFMDRRKKCDFFFFRSVNEMKSEYECGVSVIEIATTFLHPFSLIATMQPMHLFFIKFIIPLSCGI